MTLESYLKREDCPSAVTKLVRMDTGNGNGTDFAPSMMGWMLYDPPVVSRAVFGALNALIARLERAEWVARDICRDYRDDAGDGESTLGEMMDYYASRYDAEHPV
jgi:hypothetical protein